MKIRELTIGLLAGLLAAGIVAPATLADSDDDPVDKRVVVTAVADGTDAKAKDEAIAEALRKAVEQACGVFLTAQAKSENYKAVYDKVMGSTAGYVREHKVLRTWSEDDETYATVRARVSTRKFREDWASVAHTIHQEDNPRVVIAILESVSQTTTGPAYDADANGIVQGKLEDFFLEKGITLKDRETAAAVTKRDVLLAALKDDDAQVAALGARFKSDVVVTGRAAAKFGKSLDVAGQTMYQYTGTLNVRVVQSDSANVLVSKTYGPITVNTLQRGGGQDKVLAKLGEEVAPKVLSAVIEAWRRRAQVSRTVTIIISGMSYQDWKKFEETAGEIRGVQNLRLRDITEDVANIDVEYKYDTQNLADNLTELEEPKLEVTEFTPNRLKFRKTE